MSPPKPKHPPMLLVYTLFSAKHKLVAGKLTTSKALPHLQSHSNCILCIYNMVSHPPSCAQLDVDHRATLNY